MSSIPPSLYVAFSRSYALAIPKPLRPSERGLLNCDIIIWIYRHGRITNHKLLAILTDNVFCIEKRPRGTTYGLFSFFFLLSHLRDVIIFISLFRDLHLFRCRWKVGGGPQRFGLDFRDNEMLCP